MDKTSSMDKDTAAEVHAFKPLHEVTELDPIIQRKRKSLSYSVIDGSFYAVMAGFGESFFSAYAIFLGATSSQLALLGSLPQMIGSYSQLLTRRMVQFFKNRQRLVVVSAVLQALMHLFVAGAYFFGELSVPSLILFVCLYYIFAMLPSPAWSSWMGDLVDEKTRGTYFGRRNFACGIASFGAYLTAGFVLQSYTETTSQKFIGFAVLFLVAVCARLASAYFLSVKYEPSYESSRKNLFPFSEFVKSLRGSNFGVFVSFLWVFNFGVFLSGPFFAPYMLNVLGMTYWQYTLVNASTIIAKLLFGPIWGKASDKFGTRKLMILSAWLVVLVPFTWMFGTSIWYLLLINAYSGFAWAGLDITSFNFLFDTTTRERRTSAIAYHNVINGTMLLLGALLGSVLFQSGLLFSTSIVASSYMLVFFASGFFRFIACTFLLTRVKEVREFEPVKYRHLLLSELTVQPAVGFAHAVAASTMRTTKRFTFLVTDIDEFVDRLSHTKLGIVMTDIDEFVEGLFKKKVDDKNDKTLQNSELVLSNDDSTK